MTLETKESGRPAEEQDGWPVSSPAAEGTDADLLRGIGPHLEAWTDANAHAVLIVRHCKLVYERYFTGDDWGDAARAGRVPCRPENMICVL